MSNTFHPLKRITAVIFDLDDTLIDWSGQEIHGAAIGHRHLHLVYAHLAEQGHTLPERDVFLDCFGRVLVHLWTEAKVTWAGVSLAEVMERALRESSLDVAQVDMAELLRVYNWQPVPGVRPYPDTIPTLQILHQRGYKLGLITNAMQPMWMRDVELETYGLLEYLDARVTSGDTGYMKPHPAIYQRILEMLETEPSQAVFVGDRPENDIAGANAAGLTSVLIRPPHLNFDLNGARPDYTISRLSELLPILEEMEILGY
jgi:HAD superfamily hydrolase (TIGR01509 family)